jgi:hypothetical protein
MKCSSLFYNYTFPKAAGSGVDIYIVGKTVNHLCPSPNLEQFLLRYWRTHHPCTSLPPPLSDQVTEARLKKTFNGRARWGATFGGYGDADGHGHGTHVACV